MSQGEEKAVNRVMDRMVRVSRNRGYIGVLFLGEARIIRGRSHKVKRRRGVARESVKKIGDIGVILLRNGMLVRVTIKDQVKKEVILYIWRERRVSPIKEEIIGIIQVARKSIIGSQGLYFY